MNFLEESLLSWYDVHARQLPWRAMPGETPNPYHVLLSEFLLQQTTVKTVIPYFYRFIQRWPTLEALAQAPLEDVLITFAGLGYYRRARHLHACVQHIFTHLQGNIPRNVVDLKALPGVGPYIAAAVAAIAFNVSAPVVDGNIIRIAARFFALETPMPGLKKWVDLRMANVTPADRAGDFAQAMMDLGSSICTPQSPKCLECPLRAECRAYQQNKSHLFPVKIKKVPKPEQIGRAFAIFTQERDRVLLCKRSNDGLLGGMTGLPCSHFGSQVSGIDMPADIQHVPVSEWACLDKGVRHIFTHFNLTLSVYMGCVDGSWQPPAPYFWLPIQGSNILETAALPTLMKKALDIALAEMVAQ